QERLLDSALKRQYIQLRGQSRRDLAHPRRHIQLLQPLFFFKQKTAYEIVIGGRAARGGRGALTSRRERLRRACGAVPSEPGSRRDEDSRGKRPGCRTPADDARRR